MDKNKEQEIKDFLNFIIAEAKSKGKDPNAYAKELGEDGMKEAYKRFQALKLKKAQKAAHGTKLQYFRTLKNQCAEDEELYYYKKGGSVGCGCRKKKQGGEIPEAKCGAVAKFKARKMEEAGKIPPPKKEKKDNKGTGGYVKGFKNNYKALEKSNEEAINGTYGMTKKQIEEYNKKQQLSQKKTFNVRAKNDHMKCGGAVAKFKKHYLGGILNGIPFIKKV